MLKCRPPQLVLALLTLLWINAAQAAPQLESWLTAKGAKVIYVQADAIPMLDIRMVFDAGSARDGNLPGLASFTNALLTEGAGDWDADQLATRVEDQGIQLDSGSLRDMAWVSVRTLTEQDALTTAVTTLSTVVAQPRFDDIALDRVRQQMLINLRQAAQSPTSVATRRFYRALYAGHPYAHPPDGTEQSVQMVTKQDLTGLHRDFYVASNAVIALVGAIGREQAEKLAETLTADLPAGQPASVLPPVPAVKSGELRQAFPSSQSHLYIGQVGVTRDDPDYFPLYVGNHILGGGSLTSILGEEVRNQRGLSYSVYSRFRPMRVAGPFFMVAQTNNKKAMEALAVMREALASFVQDGPTDEQMIAAKRYLVGSFPLKVASNSKIVEYIAMIGFYDLPLDWLDTLTDKIDAVTLEQVQAAFQRRITPEESITVVVGGAATQK